MSENVKKNIPDKGSLLYIHFLDKVNENALFLKKDFRKALFFGLKRTEMAQINEKFQPSPVLFTKDFYLNNPNIFLKVIFLK
ncbi:hypothetical protein ['Camptotheca acuminata' phytoplasma]|uniref:hypothetical protein n=1 Tax='Camptotheca acuminata' phytoplasma TaxID=3239192 RepID=UPI00351A2897